MNVYDFDKTIYDGDSTCNFYFHCLFKYPKIFTLVPKMFGYFLSYSVFKTKTKTAFKEQMYKFLTAVPNIDKEVLIFWSKNKKKLKGWYMKQKSNADIIISASPEFLLEPICKELGVYIIASKVDKKTGKYNGENCHGEEKVKRFTAVFGEEVKSQVDEFYSDSVSDTPLALLAKKAFIVKGDKLSTFPK